MSRFSFSSALKYFIFCAALFTLCACASQRAQSTALQAFSKPDAYASGLILRASEPLIITAVASDCPLRLAAGAHIEPDGHSLLLHGVQYLPQMRACTKPAGDLRIELLAGEATFELLSATDCRPSRATVQSNRGVFNFAALMQANAEQIERWADESRVLRPWVDEPAREELSDEELERRARDCRLY